MPSSISSSEAPLDTAAVNERLSTVLYRSVPLQAWGGITIAVILALLSGVCLWEITMRHIGLEAGDLDDGRSYWAVERRRVDAGNGDPVVIVGDSRGLLDTDLSVWRRLTGFQPIQLSLMGANAQPILHDLALDPHFHGLVILSTAEFSYFTPDNQAEQILHYMKTESPSERVGSTIYKYLSHYLAFLDSNYTLFSLIEQRKWPERPGVWGPYLSVWKISESIEHRQTYLWPRLEVDGRLRRHARYVWMTYFAGPRITPKEVNAVVASSKLDIDQIRRRGGQVVWVRPPSSGRLFALEQSRYPRQLVWDPLLRGTSSFGIYFSDYPQMQFLDCPDWSHLSRASATAFTKDYIQVLLKDVSWLGRHMPDRSLLPKNNPEFGKQQESRAHD